LQGIARGSNKSDRKGKATTDQTTGNKELPATEEKSEKIAGRSQR
jgi:hypothetical protein